MILSAFTAVVVAQDAAPDEVAREHLKVLTPLVGTWQISGKGADGTLFEYRITLSWAPGKTMLLGEDTLRRAKGDEKLELQEWQPARQRFVNWDHKTKSIMETVIQPDRGVVERWELGDIIDGRFKVTQKSDSRKSYPTWDKTAIIAAETFTIIEINRKDATGTAQPDQKTVFTRVRQGA